MTPRHVLLNRPHMVHLRGFPAVMRMQDTELNSLETFMSFCAEHSVSSPDRVDIDAYAELCEQKPEALRSLANALQQLGFEGDHLKSIDTAITTRHEKVDFKGITKGRNRSYKRTVSIPPEDLPDQWQITLQRLRLEGTFALSILNRMTSRLCMFAWSADQRGLPVDLSDKAALKVYYSDLRSRSAQKNDGVPRWAYLRSTWEELRRFARMHGMPNHVLDMLSRTYDELVRLEGKQPALKFAKLKKLGSARDLIGAAEAMLYSADRLETPSRRHALRNRAAAIAIGVAVPARPEDVLRNHIFGQGIYYEADRDGYRFTYRPNKTRNAHVDELDIPLDTFWTPFIDALILQDQDSRYLETLRDRVLTTKRPLYVQFDGTPAVYAWYSRMWSAVANTGGHIARSLAYDSLATQGELGIQYGAAVNHHVSFATVEKYRSRNARRQAVKAAQTLFADSYDHNEDISDLI